MESKRMNETIVVRMDKGEEVLTTLKQVALQYDIKLAEVSALGAVNSCTVGAYSLDKQQYIKNTFKGNYEICSLTGNISTMNDAYYSHVHIVIADETGHAIGGHLNEAWVSVTCEMFIRIIEGRVDRQQDPTIGINLLHFE